MMLSVVRAHFGVVGAGTIDMVGFTAVGADMFVETSLRSGWTDAMVPPQTGVTGSFIRTSTCA